MTDDNEDPTSGFSSINSFSSDESYGPGFAALVEKVNERRSALSDLASALNESATEESDTEAATQSDQNPFEAVHQLFQERLHVPDTSELQSHTPSASKTKRYTAVTVLVVISLLTTGVLGLTGGVVDDTIFSPPPVEYVDPNDTLYLASDDAEYLNRIYRESSHEVAYCGFVTGNMDMPRLAVWIADTVRAGPDQVEFLTNNCPAEFQEVMLHTHPSGSLSLSEQDKLTLDERAAKLMCVQGGVLTTAPGAEVENLACYRQLKPNEDGIEVTRIRVVISEPSSG